MSDTEGDPGLALYFACFNEIGIINQLAEALMESHLPDGFLTSHFSVLNHLVRLGDGRTPKAIAQAFQVPKTTMTHTLAGLERAGLIRFEPNPKDARSKCVFLTEAGRAFRDKAIAQLGPETAELSVAVPPDQIEKILPVLQAIRNYMDAARD